MMRHMRRRYPSNWEQLALACKERAGWRCEHCHVEQYALMHSAKGTPYLIYLHAAHVHHDPANPTPDLIALCVSCHARYDYEHRERERRVALERLRHQHLLAKRRQWNSYGTVQPGKEQQA